jgi:hypothetical protein
MGGEGLCGQGGGLRFVTSHLLRKRALRDPDNRHLLKVLRRYHQRGELLRFLVDPRIEPGLPPDWRKIHHIRAC